MKNQLKIKQISFIILFIITCSRFQCNCSDHYSATECVGVLGVNYNATFNDSESNGTYTVGDSGVVYKYTGGDTCTKQLIASGTTENLNAAVDLPSHPFDPEPFVIVGNGGVILRAFTLISSPTTRNLNDVKNMGNDILIADGDSGTIIKSTNNGLNWYVVSSGTTEKLNTITKNSLVDAEAAEGIQSTLYAAGEDGVLLTSTDLGETWFVDQVPGGQSGPPDVNSIDFVDEEVGWAACDGGRIFKTTTSGSIWHEQFTDFIDDLNDIEFSSYSHGYTVGDNGTVLYTTTGGDAWTEHTDFDTLTTNSINSFIKVDSATFVAVGENGTFIRVVTDESTDPLSGVYTIGTSGQLPDIQTAASACDYLGISDDVTFEIEDGTYNQQVILPKILGSAPDKVVTFRSQSGNPSDVNLTFESLFPSENYTLLLNETKNVKFENLTITATGQDFSRAVEFRRNNSNISFNNVVFNGIQTASSSLDYSLVQTISDFPQNLVTFQNCAFNNGSYGLYFIGIDAFQFNYDIKVLNCSFLNCSNGISLVYSQLCNISDNSMMVTNSGISMDNCSNFNIEQNKINAMSSCIEMSSCVSQDFSPGYVTNNFLFSRNKGIRLAFENSYNNIHYNSINIANPTDTTADPSSAGIESITLSGDNNRIIDNIFDNKRRGYALNMTSTLSSGVPISELDYNNYYTNGANLANWNSVDCPDLDALRAASGMNENSASVPVNFVDSSDLHLTGSSIGDTMLIATPISGIEEDIDDELRDAIYPYMGADETASALPVELLSFSVIVNYRDVTLSWTTSLEQNNYGFNIERSKIINEALTEWKDIGFITGSGTTNSPREYSITDRELNSGSYKYRLKQIDFNGDFTYHNLSTDVIIGIPLKFNLSQNYPNPFNPSTKINYDLPFDSKVELKIFDISGREVETIINEFRQAGYYTESFNATNLSSGIYFYRISAEANGNNFVASKKMLLVK